MNRKVVIFGSGHNTFSKGYFLINKHIADFLHELANNKLDITFIQPALVENQMTSLNTTIIHDNINIVTLNKKSIRSAINVFKAILGADFVYIFYPSSWANSAAILAFLLKKPYGLYIRSSINTQKKLCQFTMHNSKISNSVQGIGQQLITLCPNIRTIRPMTKTLRFADLTSIKRTMNLDKKLKVLFVGRVEQAKGVFELLDATQKLKNENREIRLKIVGEGEAQKKVKRFCGNNKELDISIEGLVADIEEIIKLYHWADVLVLPTYYEGFPRVLFEGGAMGVALVTTSVGGIPFVMEADSDYLSITPKSSESIYLALKKLQDDPQLLNLLRIASNRFALDLFNQSESHVKLLVDQLMEMQ
jgi:glycosyltransferase involved in cell wall biosynthesis